jgi:hypothetical protein
VKLPQPVCPHGVVSTTGDGFEEPPAPGESHLDEGLSRLADELDTDEMDATEGGAL